MYINITDVFKILGISLLACVFGVVIALIVFHIDANRKDKH